MKKIKIIGEGVAFHDDWNINNTDVGGVRINGSCVERLSKDGRWIKCYSNGRPIKKLLWGENGAVMAVTEDGRVEYANVTLICNPNNKPQARDYVQEEEEESSASSKKKKSSKGGDGDSSGSGGWWKWPFKILWWGIKALFGVLLFGALVGGSSEKSGGHKKRAGGQRKRR